MVEELKSLKDDIREIRRITFETYGIVKVLSGQVVDHHGTLYGNGQPGIKDRLVTVENNQDNCPARVAATKDKRMFYVAAISVFISCIAVISQIFRG